MQTPISTVFDSTRLLADLNPVPVCYRVQHPSVSSVTGEGSTPDEAQRDFLRRCELELHRLEGKSARGLISLKDAQTLEFLRYMKRLPDEVSS